MNGVVCTGSLPLPEQPDFSQAARYMGGNIQDSTTQALLEQWAPALWREAHPRGAWVCLPLEAVADWPLGSDLEEHLKGCTHTVLLALTLGVQVDGLIRRTTATDVAGAVAVDALASALVEQLADALEKRLREEWKNQGRYLTGRFGPGYGDSPLSLQNRICTLLDTPRKMGLSLTPSLLLTPTKSTTALLGVSDHPVKGKQAGCNHCKLRETCQYRKRGTYCGVEGMD